MLSNLTAQAPTTLGGHARPVCTLPIVIADQDEQYWTSAYQDILKRSRWHKAVRSNKDSRKRSDIADSLPDDQIPLQPF